MPDQCVEQGTCTDCGESEDNYTITDTDMDVEESELEYSIRCSCGTTASVTLDSEGIAETENIHHDDASWNQEDDDDN